MCFEVWDRVLKCGVARPDRRLHPFLLPPSLASSAAVLLVSACCPYAPAPSTRLPHGQGIENDEQVVLLHQAAEIFEPQTTFDMPWICSPPSSSHPPRCHTRLPHLQGIENDERVVLMHQAAEIFEPQTEHVYKYLQVSDI